MKRKNDIPHRVDEVVMLPDNTILTDARKMIIKYGYDHYFTFHNKAQEWANFGCPICIYLLTKHLDDPNRNRRKEPCKKPISNILRIRGIQ